MTIRLRTAAFALLLAAPAFAACTAEPTAPVDRPEKLNADVTDTLKRGPSQPWN